MAVTKIHPIKNTLYLALDYIMNEDKTDEKILITSFACNPQTAHLEFEQTKKECNSKAKILARHLIQAFAPGETIYTIISFSIMSALKPAKHTKVIKGPTIKLEISAMNFAKKMAYPLLMKTIRFLRPDTKRMESHIRNIWNSKREILGKINFKSQLIKQ